MRYHRMVVHAYLCGGLLAVATAAAQTAEKPADKTSTAVSSPTVVGSVLVLMPVKLADDRTLGDGCWVRFYDGKNYRGSNLTLVGPVNIPAMNVPDAVWRDWDSAIVGPKAHVTTYDNEHFRDRTAQLAPDQYIADLGEKKLGWFDEIHSARVTCSE